MTNSWDERRNSGRSGSGSAPNVVAPDPKPPRKLDLPRREIPDDVRAALADRQFNSWSSCRRAVYQAWAKSPSIQGDPLFSKENVERMELGLAPLAPADGHAGKRMCMELDHRTEVRDMPDKEAKYDLANLSLRTPRSHTMKLRRKFDIHSGALKPQGKSR